MADARRRLTFLLTDAPLVSDRVVTAFRILHAAVDRGHHVHVFAFEGGTEAACTWKKDVDATRERGEDRDDQALPRQWIASLATLASKRGGIFDWIDGRLCHGERCVERSTPWTRCGTPVDFARAVAASDNALVIPLR